MKKKLRRVVPLVLIFSFLLPIGACAANDDEVYDPLYLEPGVSAPVEVDGEPDNEPPETGDAVQVPIPNMEDVSPDDWFYRYVLAGIRFGIIQGTNEDGFRFEPDRALTRAEFITMLGRLHEYSGETIGAASEGRFYERYINWAVESNIIHGDEHGNLMPNERLNREQMVVIMHRYLLEFDLWDSAQSDAPFITAANIDNREVSSWAFRSMSVFRRNGLLRTPPGFSGWYFRPHDYATRAEGIVHLVVLAQRLGV
ncbi:MAG: S-layer homology domain-containing protein [Oscillospiraceae bacterium]|nr:S-layer homology domain-containing protein [Oscillospiraceae bacterium]